MKYYMAPMEGITGYIFRSVYQNHFAGIDKYFTPFIVPNQSRKLSPKEEREILPDHNKGMHLVPQIMANKAEDFLVTVDKLRAFGYQEVNLNLGCPSKTVVSKKRGAGFLRYPEELKYFLEKVFQSCAVKVSIKTRLGVNDPEEFEQLLHIFNSFPLEELIIHPRVQKDAYENVPNWKAFSKGLEQSNNPVCYNGDLCSVSDYEKLQNSFEGINAVMFGRGILKNPALIRQIKDHIDVEKQQIRRFHDDVYEAYQKVLFGEKPLLYKMKEIWSYMCSLFTDSEKYAKKIRKAESIFAYDKAVNSLFEEQEIKNQLV